MNTKKLLIGAATLLLVGAAGWFWKSTAPSISTRILTQDENDITAAESDLDWSEQDQALANETDQTLNDVSSDTGSSGAFDSSAIRQENDAINASQELNASTNDRTLLEETNTSLNEVSQ